MGSLEHTFRYPRSTEPGGTHTIQFTDETWDTIRDVLSLDMWDGHKRMANIEAIIGYVVNGKIAGEFAAEKLEDME